jgi:hypothetical protein
MATKIAVVCAIGWLDSHGYQYVAPTCIGSMAEFADVVYLVQSTRNRNGVDELMRAYPNIVHIADDRTWFSDYPDEHEITHPWFHNRNLGIGMQTAAADGADCIVGMHNNWYIPRRNMAALRARCEAVVRENVPIEWLYRGTQLANALFHVSHHVKFIVNAHHLECFAPGKVADKARKLYPPASRFKELDATMVVDAPLEMPMADLADVWNWSKCYDGRVGGSTVFKWEAFRPIYRKDVSHKAMSRDPLDRIGEMIARDSRKDFVSHIVLQDMGLEHV